MKYIFVFFIFLCVTASIFALDFGFDGAFAGIGPEINGYSRTRFSFGGDLTLGIDLNDSFSAGLETGFFDNFDTVSALETALFFRYYFPWLNFPKDIDGPFAQLEAGCVVFFERGRNESPEIPPSFIGGLSAGWRINLGEHWYVEPAVRVGYPHVWGFGVTAGIRFKKEKAVVYEQVKETGKRNSVQLDEVREDEIEEPVEEEPKEEIITEIAEEIPEETTEEADEGVKIVQEDNLRLPEAYVIFRANRADFTGLSGEIVQNNYEIIRRVAELMNEHKDYMIVIQGHANPTTPEGRARERERYTLIRLSQQRALKVMEELGKLGVSYRRMTISGEGSAKTVVPYNDKTDNWKNRRVEFILVKEGDTGGD
jgi:outer membrane protein OmpA-like peptidoglycan-associated protein